MINMKEAYSYAVQYFRELVGNYECDLEEIELSPNNKYWIITLSYYEAKPRTGFKATIKFVKKLAKTITVNSGDGAFFRMKIAKL